MSMVKSTENPYEVRNKVKNLLKELFRFDAEDLDFGIYRIMNFKREEIKRFIEKDLIEAVEAEFKEYAKVGVNELQKEVERLKAEIIRDFGEGTIDAQGRILKYEDAPKIKEYLQRVDELNNAKVSEAQMNEVLNHIYEFFSRYYENGDFISKRRYGGRDKYYIPYNGEEVILHWATRDQYYVKTTEYFRSYTFKTGNYQVNFLLKEAEMDVNNVVNEDKYFILCNSDFVDVDERKRRIDIYFEYRALTDKEKHHFGTTNVQELLVKDSLKRISSKLGDSPAGIQLRVKVDEERTILEKHLNIYVKRNTTDYFIHKNLKAFLERELEFYIKNEVVDLDELDNFDERSLRIVKAKVKAIKGISKKIIEFLAQIEDFQKMLFEKKKFIIGTEYVITLDKIKEYAGEEFLESIVEEILKNTKQLEEWKEILRIEVKSKNDLIEKQTLQGKEWKRLPLDTRLFDIGFKTKLLEALSERNNIDEILDGILIKSENWQALNLLLNKYYGKIQTIYIDPPFNKEQEADYLYKVKYKDSTWATILENRIRLGKELLNEQGSIFVRCDYNGNWIVRPLMDEIFGKENFRNEIVVSRTKTALYIGTPKKLLKNLGPSYDNIYWYSKNPNISFLKISEGILKIERDAYWKDLKSFYNRPNYRYEILGIIPEEGCSWVWKKEEVLNAIDNYEKFKESYKNELLQIREISTYIREKLGEKIATRFEDTINYLLEKYWNDNSQKLKFVRKGDNTFYYWVEPIQKVSITDWTSIEGYARRWKFPTENSENLLKNIIELTSSEGELVIDFFLGSGTTTAVAHKLKRKWIGIEMGDYFDNIPLKRMKAVLAGEQSGISKEVGWQGGGFFKYHYVEQYEDTLNNIIFREKDRTIQETLESFQDYFLRYMLDYETKDSPTRLNVEQFQAPFDYKIWVTSGGEKRLVTVDLVETFNYLLGLNVERFRTFKDNDREYRVVFGRKGNESIVVIWRNSKDLDLKRDKEFIENTILAGIKPDRIFINGDSLVEKAEPIEPEFRSLMGA